MIHLSWPDNGKYNYRVKNWVFLLHQIVFSYSCNEHLTSLLQRATSAPKYVSKDRWQIRQFIYFDNLRTINQEGVMKTTLMTPFFSSAFQALTV